MSRSTIIVVAVVLSMITVLAVPAAAADGFDGDPTTTERLGEDLPVDFAVQVSNVRFEDEARHAVLSRYDTFADSLTGTSLTGDGPLLFTLTDDLPGKTRQELDRVLGTGATVYLLGGVEAISQSVEDEIADMGFDVERLYGATRIETAIAIADEARRLQGGDRVLLARSHGPETAAWADSVSAGVYAAVSGNPILLTSTDSMNPKVASWLDGDRPGMTVVLGGIHALSQDVEDAAPNAKRIYGDARDGTAAAVARQLFGVEASGERRFVVMNGWHDSGWRFGLAAAGLGAESVTPMLLVRTDAVPHATLELATSACDKHEIDVLVAGGTNFVPQEPISELDARDGYACPPFEFGDGTHRVPEEVPADTYRTMASDGCYWERLSGFSGETSDIEANEFADYPMIVEISPADEGFRSERCDSWSNDLSARTSAPTADFGEGDFQVGKEVAAGTWRNSDSSDDCYWERLSGWSGENQDIIANGFSNSIQTVTIQSGDVGFSSTRCGTWTRIE